MRNAIRPSFLFLKEVFVEQNNMKCTGNIGAKQCGRLMRYSMQLIMLQKLLRYKLLSEREYIAVKERLMKDYGIVSDFTA